MKLRNWPYKQPIVWEIGKGESLWRQDRICTAQTIYLCEGETDAIGAIDTGIEDEPGIGVMCIPSASTLPANLVKSLVGKHVVVCMDNDSAGWSATEDLGALLLPQCASVTQVNPGEVVDHE
jgi:DNA primase